MPLAFPYHHLVIPAALIFIFHYPAVQSCFWSIVQPSEQNKQAIIRTTPTPPLPVVSNCGHSKYYYSINEPGVGIVGGQNILPNQYPWVARLKIASGSSSSLCGSAIINRFWLLTAAHCVDGVFPSNVSAIFGDYDRTITDSSEYTRKIANITIHHLYNADDQDYDFALLKLANPLSFLDWNTQQICLPKSCADGCAVGTYAYIAGWGTTSETSFTAAKIMQTGLVKIVDPNVCKTLYSNTGRTVTDRMTCANLEGVDSCAGDSGGPLMVVEDGFYKLCGTTSYGNGCARESYPGVYGRVCTVVDWVEATTDTPAM